MCRERSSINMISIKDYSLEYKSDSGVFKVHSFEIVPCPCCGGLLVVCGSRKRKLTKADGSKQVLGIRRLECELCGKIHHELPDIIVPYKRYEAAAVESALSSDDSDTAGEFPGEENTLRRLQLWFCLLQTYFNEVLVSLTRQLCLENDVLLPLCPLKRQAAGWLKCLVRHTVNSGLWLQTRSVSTF